jgi:hypothetical protein
LLARVDRDHARIATLDPRTGELRALGEASPVPSRCALVGQRLACIGTNSDTIDVWRVPE